MTTVSPDLPILPQKRQSRYVRDTKDIGKPLTLHKLRFLRWVKTVRLASLPQLAALEGCSPKNAARHLRVLFDNGLVNLIAVPRAALAEESEENDARLLFGSAPNIYSLSRLGAKFLSEWEGEEVKPSPHYGPQNFQFLRHELAIRDVFVWLKCTARHYAGHTVERWESGADAVFDLGRKSPPYTARPDGLFVYRFGTRVLVGLVEVDRGTERGGKRWQEKVTAYEALFASGRLRELTGYQHARVLTLAPNQTRCEKLATQIQQAASAEHLGKFWLAERSLLNRYSLTPSVWRIPGNPQLQPLLAPALLAGGQE